MTPKIVLCFSGGLDSTVLAAWLIGKGYQVIGFSVNYGQRHQKELSSAMKIAEFFNERKQHSFISKIVSLPGLQSVFDKSALMNPSIEIPEGHYESETMKSTIVPNRNMILLSLATAFAINEGAEAVALAAHSGDHAIYPDCREDFIESIRSTIRISSSGSIRLLTNFITHTKTEIAALGAELRAPMFLSWSCYKGGHTHCGRCATCVERQEAFFNAGLEDLTEYEDSEFWKEAVKKIL